MVCGVWCVVCGAQSPGESHQRRKRCWDAWPLCTCETLTTPFQLTKTARRRRRRRSHWLPQQHHNLLVWCPTPVLIAVMAVGKNTHTHVRQQSVATFTASKVLVGLWRALTTDPDAPQPSCSPNISTSSSSMPAPTSSPRAAFVLRGTKHA